MGNHLPMLSTPMTWETEREYKALSVVLNGGESYIARQDVPSGTSITNTDYWMTVVSVLNQGGDTPTPTPGVSRPLQYSILTRQDGEVDGSILKTYQTIPLKAASYIGYSDSPVTIESGIIRTTEHCFMQINGKFNGSNDYNGKNPVFLHVGRRTKSTTGNWTNLTYTIARYDWNTGVNNTNMAYNAWVELLPQYEYAVQVYNTYSATYQNIYMERQQFALTVNLIQ